MGKDFECRVKVEAAVDRWDADDFGVAGAEIPRLQAVGVEMDASLDVPDERIVGPTVPQPSYNIVELTGFAVSFGMFNVFLQAEIEGCLGVGCSDEVPARATIADVVQRGELAGDAVAIKPRRSVTTASAGRRVSGSNEVVVALRFRASIGMLSRAR